MHKSSYMAMKEFADKYIFKNSQNEKLKVLDVGSQMIDGQQELGSYKSIFGGNDDVLYMGCDMVSGLNVDIVLESPYNWSNIEESTFDYVISGQMLEHVEFPWLTFVEINRVLKPGGICCIIAPSAGPMHNYPLDCFRYYPDGLAALAAYAGMEIIDVYAQWEKDKYPYLDNFWHDCVLIARKKAENNPNEINRRNILVDISKNYVNRTELISRNPVLDFSLWKPAGKKYAAKLYLDFGEGFSEKNTMRYEYFDPSKRIKAEFKNIREGIKHIRFDPCEQSCIVTDLRAVITQSGNSNIIEPIKINSDKIIERDNSTTYLFGHHDPWFLYDLNAADSIEKLTFDLSIDMIKESTMKILI